LESILKQSPSLASLFLSGARASNPFKTVTVSQEEERFEGKTHPTYFKFKGKDYGKVLVRDCHINQRCRITFESDAVNEYFKRQVNSGSFSLFRVSGQHRSSVSDYVGPHLQTGIAVLNMALPSNCEVDDQLEFEAIVSDPIVLDNFVNRFRLIVKAELVHGIGEPGKCRKPPSQQPGKERELPSGITIPNIIPVYEKDWNTFDPPFDCYSALRIGITDESGEQTSADDDNRHDVFDFKINMDNVFLKTELTATKDDFELIHKRWQYSLVLVGLAFLHEDRQHRKTNHNDSNGSNDFHEEVEDGGIETIEDKVAKVSTALAPVLLPMIDSLGSLDVDASETVSVSAEAN